MSFMANDIKLLKAHNKIWKKVTSLMKREFDSEPAYCDKYIKTKIKLYGNIINKNFHGNEIPKENVSCACLSVIFGSVVRVGKKYYPQAILKECKYEAKKVKSSILLIMT